MAARNVLEEKIRLYVEAEGDKELSRLGAELSQLAKGSDAAAGQAQALISELEKLAATSGNIKQFTTLKASIADTGTALEAAKKRLAELGAESDRTERPTAKLQRSLKNAALEVENLSKQQNRQQVALQRTGGALRAAGVDTDKLAVAYDELQGQFGEFADRAGGAADAMRQTARDGRAAASGVSTLDKAATRSKRSLAEIATQLTLVSGAATTAFKGLAALSGAALFKGGIDSATTLEQALSEVQAVSSATKEELQQLKEAAELGGSATRFSTLEAAQGLGELARATGSAQSAIATLPATLSLAQAAGLGVAEAAQFITTTLTQYGLAADQAARVSDVLALAANATTADVEGLGNALTYAAPLANLLGLDVERTAAIIGTLADQGFRGERAGTALRNVFSEMLDPASDFAKALRDLGIESTDFTEVIDQLATKGRRGQDALLKLDAAARPAILSLVNNGGAALRQLDTDLRNAAGSAEETARIMGDNLSGAGEQIKDTFDRTRRSLVEPLLEPLKDELFFLAGQLEEFAASPEFEEIKVALAGMFSEGADAARDLIQNVDFAELADNIKVAISSAGETITDFKENLDTIVTAVATIGNSFQLVFNTVQAAVFLVAGALAKLAAAGAAFGDAFTGPARSFLEFLGVLEKGQYDLSEIAGGLNAVGDEFGSRFVTNVDEATAAAQRLAGAGRDAGDGVASGLAMGSDAATGAAKAFTTLAPVVVTASDALRSEAAAATQAGTATTAAAQQVVAGAERLQKAFADMGLTSQVELQRAAESARANFDLIRAAVARGEASAEDARRAFAKYSEAARTAVAQSDESAQVRVDSELLVTATILGSAAALDEVGEAGIRAGRNVAIGGSEASSSLQGLTSQAQETSRTVQRGVDGVAQSMTAAGDSATMVGDAANRASISLGSMNGELAKAYLATNRYAGQWGIWVNQFNLVTRTWREQSDAIRELNDQMDAQLAKLDPLADKLADLRSAYPFVEEAQLRATAEKQQRLEDEAQRLRDDAKRVRAEALQERQAASQDVSSVSSGSSTAAGSGSSPVGGVSLRDLGSITVTLPNGVSGNVVTDDAGASLIGQMFDELSRSRAISTRRRR